MNDYAILLPPSEGKNKGGNIQENFYDHVSFKELNNHRKEIINKLLSSMATMSESKLEKLFDVTGYRVVETVEKNSTIEKAPLMKAIDRYSGVMFKSINYPNLPKNMQKRFDEKILFIDAIFGLLKPTDLIPDYKLKINGKLEDFDITRFWTIIISKTLEKEAKNKLIIDILPQAHRAAINFDQLNYVTIEFCETKKDKIISSGHASKKLKGEIIRYILQFDKVDRKLLEEFSHTDGYSYNNELSNENKIVYLK